MIRLSDPADFGQALRRMQAKAGVDTVKLTEQVDCTRSHISNLRWGKFAPSFELAIQIAHALGYDLALIPKEGT